MGRIIRNGICKSMLTLSILYIRSLPIAAELRSRRSKASLASDQTTSTTAFPSASTPNPRREAAFNAYNGSPDGSQHQMDNSRHSHMRTESLRKRSQSSPMRSESPNVNHNSNANAADLSTASSTFDQYPYQPPTSAPSTSKKARTNEPNPPTGSRHVLLAPSSSSASKQRSRAVTNNISSSTTRKSPHLNSPTSGPRRPLQASSNTMNRQASTPLKKKVPSSTPPSTRVRSSSTSLLSNSIQHDWDEHSKPPWLDENPTYLYKSDIEPVSPGSLADIARHAQGRTQTSTFGGTEGDTSMNADTSVRSWDDVILPAVAKQIRAQQMLEMQKNAQARRGGNATGGNLLVTDWDANGTPTKWRGIKGRDVHDEQTLPTPGQEQELPHAEATTDLHVPPRERPRTQSLSHLHPQGTRSPGEHMYQNPSLSSHHLGTQQVPSSVSIESQTNSNGSRPSHHTGRRELWDDPALRSPDTAAQNGFANAQTAQYQPHLNRVSEQRYTQAHEPTFEPRLTKEEQQHNSPNPKQKEEEKDTHGRGCCKCTIM